MTQTTTPKKQRLHSDVKTVTLPKTAVSVATVLKPSTTAARSKTNSGFSLKKYSQQSLLNALTQIKQLSGITVVESITEAGLAGEANYYAIQQNGIKKLNIRYVLKAQALQVQGKTSPLLKQIVEILQQSIVTQDAPLKISSIKMTQPKTKAVTVNPELEKQKIKEAANAAILKKKQEEKQLEKIKREEAELAARRKKEEDARKKIIDKALGALNKHISTALILLPSQSITDLCMGYADIIISTATLSDYSGLLTAPYRALEKYIFALQMAKGINVKMIGQAFDKTTEGRHYLKASFNKKIGSVIFAEVLDALYIEYFNNRNYYTHSDSTDLSPRHIYNRVDVVKIFNNLLHILEYNSKKLKEINFKF